MGLPERRRKPRLTVDERERAIRYAASFARGDRLAFGGLSQLFAGGHKAAGVPPEWYGALARELAAVGLLKQRTYPPSGLKILAKCVGYYLWFAVAAVESDRGDEAGCREVLDGIVAFLGHERLHEFDFERLQPRAPETSARFDLRVVQRLVGEYLGNEEPFVQTIRSLVRQGRTSEASQRIKEWPRAQHGLLPFQELGQVFNQLADRTDLQPAVDFALWREGNGYPLNQRDWAILLKAARANEDRERLAQVVQLAEPMADSADDVLTQELLCAYDRLGLPAKAITLFTTAQARGLSLNKYHYTAMISVATQQGDLSAAAEHFYQARRLDPADGLPYTAMITAYGRTGQAGRAREIFALMRSAGCLPDVRHYAGLAGAYAQAGEVGRAREVFHEMVAAGFTPQTGHYNLLIKVYGRTGRIDEARETFDEMQAAGVRPDTYSFGALLSAYSQGGRGAEAQELFDRMAAAQVTPDAYHYGVVINAHGQAGRPEQAHAAYDRMVAAGHAPDAYHYGAVVNAYGQAGRPDEADELLHRWVMDATLSAVDRTYLYNLAIKAYSYSDRLTDVNRLKDEMLAQGLTIDQFTLGSIARTYERAGVMGNEDFAPPGPGGRTVEGIGDALRGCDSRVESCDRPHRRFTTPTGQLPRPRRPRRGAGRVRTAPAGRVGTRRPHPGLPGVDPGPERHGDFPNCRNR